MRSAEILFGTGLNSLRFGATTDDVERLLGKATERREYPDGDLQLSYEESGVHLFFPAIYENRLAGIEADAVSDAKVRGHSIFSLKKSAILRIIAPNVHRVEFQNLPDERGIHLHALGATLYFSESGDLVSVQWSPLVNGRDQIVWPETPLASPP